MYHSVTALVAFLASVITGVGAVTCPSNFVGSTCQYSCLEFCRGHTSCSADRCDVPRCDCSAFGARDTSSGLCVCESARSGDVCEYSIEDSSCSQSQGTGRLEQPMEWSTCPASPAPATAACVNASYTYNATVKGEFEWPTHPCFPPVGAPVKLYPLSQLQTYIGLGPRDEFVLNLWSSYPGSVGLFEASYDFTLRPFSWSATASERTYTIHSAYEHRRTLEVDTGGPDPATNRIRVFLSPTRMTNPTVWYICAIGNCFIRPTRFPGYGLTVSNSTGTVFCSNQSVTWQVTGNTYVTSSASGVAINVGPSNATNAPFRTVSGPVDNIWDCYSHMWRDRTLNSMTWNTLSQTCVFSTRGVGVATGASTGATTIVQPIRASGGAVCGSRYYSFPVTPAENSNTACTKKFVGPVRLLFGTTPSTLMLVADTAASSVAILNINTVITDTKFSYWNISDETGNGREVTIRVAFLPTSTSPKCLALDANDAVVLETCDPDDQRMFWFLDRSTISYDQGFNLRPSVKTEASGISLVVSSSSLVIESGHTAGVFEDSTKWSIAFSNIPSDSAGDLDGWYGPLRINSSTGGLFVIPSISLSALTYDPAHCASLCMFRQPLCAAAQITTAGVCQLYGFEDEAPIGTAGVADRERVIYSTLSSGTSGRFFIVQFEVWKSVFQQTFPPLTRVHCTPPFFKIQDTNTVGTSLFMQQRYRDGYFCGNSLDYGPVLLKNFGYGAEFDSTIYRGNARDSVVLDVIDSTDTARYAGYTFLYFHNTGIPGLYTIHLAMEECITLEADVSTSSTSTTRRVFFSGKCLGTPTVWSLSSAAIIPAVTNFALQPVNLPGWFLQITSASGAQPASIGLLRQAGLGYNTWVMQYGFKNSGLSGVVLDNKRVTGTLLPPNCNFYLDFSDHADCYPGMVSPTQCNTICAMRADCAGWNFNKVGTIAEGSICQTYQAIDLLPPADVAISDDVNYAFGVIGTAYYTNSRCLIDNYQPIITTGIGPTANSMDTWVRGYASSLKCNRRLYGPYNLYQTTTSTVAVGTDIDLQDYSSTTLAKLVQCDHANNPFEINTGCKAATSLPRSIVMFEEMTWNTVRIRMYWMIANGLETMADFRYLTSIDGVGLRFSDYRGYRALMLIGFGRQIYDGRLYNPSGTFTGYTSAAPSNTITAAYSSNLLLTLDPTTGEVGLDTAGAGKRQTWSALSPGIKDIKWGYTFGAAQSAAVIGSIPGVLTGGQCELLCWSMKRCAQAVYNQGDATCTISRENTSPLINTANQGQTLYARQPFGSVVVDGTDTWFPRIVAGWMGTACLPNCQDPGGGFVSQLASWEGNQRPVMALQPGQDDASFLDMRYDWFIHCPKNQVCSVMFAAGTDVTGTNGARRQVLQAGINIPSALWDPNAYQPILGFNLMRWCTIAGTFGCGDSVPGGGFDYRACSFTRYQHGSCTWNTADMPQFSMIQLPRTYPPGYPGNTASTAGCTPCASSIDDEVVFVVSTKRTGGGAQSFADSFLAMPRNGGSRPYLTENQYDTNIRFFIL